jgi:hypothetical protein
MYPWLKPRGLQVGKMPLLHSGSAHACRSLSDFHRTPHGTPGEGASPFDEDGAPAREKPTPFTETAPHGTPAPADKSPGDSQVWQDGQDITRAEVSRLSSRGSLRSAVRSITEIIPDQRGSTPCSHSSPG